MKTPTEQQVPHALLPVVQRYGLISQPKHDQHHAMIVTHPGRHPLTYGASRYCLDCVWIHSTLTAS